MHPTQQLCAAALLLSVLAGCSGDKFFADVPKADNVTDTIRNTDLTARFPAALDPRAGPADRTARPMLFPGSELVAAGGSQREGGADTTAVAADGTVTNAGGVEINFDNADIQTVAKTLLGDVLGLNYVIDPRIQGNFVTLASTTPIPRKDVLPVFESVLRMSNAAVVREGSLIKIVPIPEASGAGSVQIGVGQPGYGVAIVPLRFTAAAAVARTAENFLSRPGAIRADQARNILLIQGTATERQTALDVVQAFDVEWMRNQSVGVYPLKSTSPETMIRELERVFDTSEGGQGQGVVRFQPISRMNAVMVVAKSPKFLQRATQWVQRLDRSDTSGTTVRIYRLKFGSAPRIAKILNEIFVGGRGTADTPLNQIAPGATASTSRLDALGGGTTGGGAGGSGGGVGLGSGGANVGALGVGSGSGAPSGGAGSRGSGSPVASAFEAFGAGTKDSDASGAGGGGLAGGAGGAGGRAVFQNVRITPDAADNSIVVYSNQEDYRAIENAVRELDRQQLQVSIEATVAEVTLTDSLQFGVQYFLKSSDVGLHGDNGSVGLSNANANGSAAAAAASGTTTNPTAGIQSAIQGLALQRVLPGFNLLLGPEAQPRVILNALSGMTSVKVLSAPSLVVVDNQPAVLQVGDQIPVSTGSATVLTTQNTVVNTIDRINTGVILKVLPHVHANGQIQLEVEQEISNVVPGDQGSLTPTISQRRVRSTVSVTTGQTILLGGLISEQDSKSKSGIPGLSQIRFLGDVFGNTNNNKTRSEIIIFIKPQLIRNGGDASVVAEEFRERLESMRRTGVLYGPDVPATAPLVRKD